MNDRTGFLRKSLQLDGVASGLTGALLLFGAALLWHAGRARVSRAEALGTVALNAAWVLVSVAVIAVLEVVGLRRLREA